MLDPQKMQRTLLKSKIHRATVTDANVDYEGSISIDVKLCEAANIHAYEKVDIYNIDNGSRFSTYVLYGKEGEICLNGAAARLVQKGEKIIIASYVLLDERELRSHRPRIILLDEENHLEVKLNQIRRIVEGEAPMALPLEGAT